MCKSFLFQAHEALRSDNPQLVPSAGAVTLVEQPVQCSLHVRKNPLDHEDALPQ
eukprot:CAMPEP_0194525758 /NCGR_PEP_ID=MMETSP0253-20130528/61350_1 /TAXON_ID=2966 /ORGANISM="Noctiluca scintillans" /LENGTH=53 /DNA_ID=CAMNT_0039370523 /DNA_START=80 /DNA_END=238 /DNA_ORIENTATION=-